MTDKKTFRKKVELPSDKDETKVKVKPKAIPDHSNQSAQVRLNAAAILREEARLRKEEEAKKAKLEAAMIDMRDESEFENWRSKMRAKDEQARLEQLQVRKIEMELAREEAMEAFALKQKEKKVIAAKLKIESEDKAQELEYENFKKLEEKKRNAIDIYENRANIAVEQEKVMVQKKKVKKELQKEIEEAIALKKEQDELEQLRRNELIQQIRELESQPINRVKGFDPNEMMNFGLLEEMSYAQLKERLDKQKKLAEEEISERREENMRKKEERAQDIVGKAAKITEYRTMQAQANEERRNKKKEEIERKRKFEEELREKNMLTVYDKISAKKKAKAAEQARLEKELEEIKLKRQYLNANKALVEEKAWKEQEAGAERQAKDKQARALIDQERVQRIKMSENNLRTQAAKGLATKQREIVNDYQKSLAEARTEDKMLRKEEQNEKTGKYQKQKQFEADHKQRMDERQPYAAKINATSISNSKSKK